MKKILLPGSKSITNRDFILASLCNGKCEIRGYLKSDDTKYMIEALRDLGINIVENNGVLIVEGGVNNIFGNNKVVYVHQSGTCMRFLTGFGLLNKSGTITITGEERLLSRPMGALLDGIKQMGIKFDSNGDFPPVKIFPSVIVNNKIKMNGTSSSQFFTSLFQVGAFIKGGLEIEVIGDMVSKPYLDMTIEELRKFGVKVENIDYKRFIISEQEIKNPGLLQVEGDASALTYIANYSLLFDKEINVLNIGNDSKQGDYKYLNILEKYFNFGFLSSSETTVLKGSNILELQKKELYREIDFENMPYVSMSFMSLAPLLAGETKIIGLQTLNLKECKRIDAMGTELRKLGVELEYDDKSITIKEGFHPDKEIDIETYNDHRIAMVFGVLKIYLEKNYDTKINILNRQCVSKTYPNFWDDLEFLEVNNN